VHTVTKVLVVFAAILCVLLAALTMAFSVNADRIVASHNKEVELRVATETSSKGMLTQAATEQARLNQDIQQLNTQKTQLGTQIASLQGERTKLLQDVATATNARDAIVNQIDQLAATNKTQALLIDSYRNEVTKLRENELTYRKREIELVDRLNDLESQREVQDGSIRALREMLEESRRALDAAGGPVQSGRIASDAPIRPSFPVSGKVTEVSRDAANNKPMAVVNVGTNNQIRENMQLVITRGNQFIANFTVKQADLQWSRGEINYLGKTVTVQPGDNVQSLVSR
jgi:hypothetical protein